MKIKTGVVLAVVLSGVLFGSICSFCQAQGIEPYAGFKGKVGRTFQDSAPWWPEPPKAPEGAPNIVIVLADDLGFSDIGAYGSEIMTPQPRSSRGKRPQVHQFSNPFDLLTLQGCPPDRTQLSFCGRGVDCQLRPWFSRLRG
jgi:hypothetical protein